MSNKLEFRVWNGKNLIYPKYINFGWKNAVCISDDENKGIMIENPVIQQWTGLKDRKGKKIFVGDKVKVISSEDGVFSFAVSFQNAAFTNGSGVCIFDLIYENYGDDSQKNVAEVVGHINN